MGAGETRRISWDDRPIHWLICFEVFSPTAWIMSAISPGAIVVMVANDRWTLPDPGGNHAAEDSAFNGAAVERHGGFRQCGTISWNIRKPARHHPRTRVESRAPKRSLSRANGMSPRTWTAPSVTLVIRFITGRPCGLSGLQSAGSKRTPRGRGGRQNVTYSASAGSVAM